MTYIFKSKVCGIHVLIFCICTFLSTSVMSSKILMLPYRHISHVKFNIVGGRTLKQAGHDVWLLTSENYKQQVESHGIHPIVYNISEDAYHEKLIKDNSPSTTEKESHLSCHKTILSALFKAGNLLCREVLGDETLMTHIENLQFDLMIVDNVPWCICMYIIPYRLSIPYISLGPITDPWVMGVSSLPSLEPHLWAPVIHPQGMPFTERVVNLAVYILQRLMFDRPATFPIEEFAPGKPSTTFTQLVAGSEIYLLTWDNICMGYPRVSAPNYQYIGSLTASDEPTPLATELELFLQESPGFIVVAFGSLMKATSETIQPFIVTLLDALHSTTYYVILQFQKDLLDNIDLPSKTLVLDWIPQRSLLKHPKMRLFITHGGLNSVLESIRAGVPMMVVPMQTEQRNRANLVQAKGYGKAVDIYSTSSAELARTMDDLLHNSTYRNNVQQCADIQASMPNAQEKLVFWVNHILQFGGEHLRPPGLGMPWYQFFMLDILAFVILILAICSALGFLVIRWCVRKVLYLTKQKDKKE